MRIILTAFLLTVTFFDFAQIIDDFSDGDFTNNPAWTGETSVFEIDANNQLHLIAPAVTDTAYLSTANTLVDNIEWTFLINLDFNPSNSNLARVFLMSNQSDLEGNLEGYFVQIGGTSDEVSLYKQSGATITEIIDGTDNLVDSSPVSVRVTVTRTINGEWNLKIDNTGNFNFVNQGSVTDNTHTVSSNFGIFCKYTSTRSDKFYFDDFTIEPMTILDTVPPQIINVEVISSQILHVRFTERVDELTAQTPSNYSADNNLGSPIQAEVLNTNDQIVILTYASSFQDGLDYILSIQNVEDDSSNVMLFSTINFTYNKPIISSYKDIIITELMVDPNPVVGLPEEEYVELFNNTGQTISLENWTISDGSTTITFSDQPFPSQSYLLCYNPQSGVNFGILNTIETQIPTLNNTGDVIVLRDNNGIVIDSVAYRLSWYKSVSKALGGWSLELKNVYSPCHDLNNWGASENSSGGTPGTENSIYTNAPNIKLPNVTAVFIENGSSVHFVFDKDVSGGVVSINPSLSQTIDLFGSELIVTLTNFDKNQIYQITISKFSDCWGNVMNDFVYSFAVPDDITAGDIIINEILFNPENGGADYVEIVNVTGKVLSLSQLQLANIEDGEIDNQEPLFNQQILFFPEEYLILTKDSLAIIETFPNYKTGHFHQMDLPLFNNDSGTVVLMADSSILVDKFSYSSDLHFALIDDLNGKALERLSFNQPTQSKDNWHTASESEGWGTPGFLNSQTINSFFGQELQLSKAIFSPDNDGYQDVLEITYQFDDPDNVMDIVIYNANGQPIRELKDNFYPGKKGNVIWDGITDEGTKAYVGTYIIGATVFDLEGNIKRYKLICVLAAQL